MSNRNIVVLFFCCVLCSISAFAGDKLAQDFQSPPEVTKPRCYWYWCSGRYSKEGITKDLEAMHRAGIGEAYIGTVFGTAPGGVKYLTEEWWQYMDHAIREGTRIGVDICLFLCPGGWNAANGPWVKPEQSMRYMALDEVHVQGPGKVKLSFPAPKKNATLITFLAFPTPAGDEDEILKHTPKVSGDTKTGTITYELAEPFTARSLIIKPESRIDVTCELEASLDGKAFQSVCQLPVSRLMGSALSAKGPIIFAPVAVSFPAVSAKVFRVKFSKPCAPVQITLSAAARIERYMEKQLATMFEGNNPPFDYYTWSLKAEPDQPNLVVRKDSVVAIQPIAGPDGALVWEVPSGNWVVQRIMAAPTGVSTVPTKALEVDKMSPAAIKAHYQAFIGKLNSRLSAAERKSLKRVMIDSWEVGAENWTEDLFDVFQSRYGYDPRPFLPTLSGRLVGSADQSDRFLWNLRRLVADRIATDFISTLREMANRDGLKLWLENYGHGGFPAEFLNYASQTDEVSDEFWNTKVPSITNNGRASSAAHIYGKKEVFSEAFTCGYQFRSTPAWLKSLGDQAYSRGINQFVLHVYLHQPDERKPGVYAFGTEFYRHTPWFDYVNSFLDYQRRCTVMLQAGNPVSDLAYYITEDTPKMTGPNEPTLPSGYDSDCINADVIEHRLSVKDGRFVLPDGTSYKLLVLPASQTMRPEVLKKIKELVEAGGQVQCSLAPSRSPSLQNFPACDEAVRVVAKELWSGGKIITNGDLASVLARLQTLPDVIAPKSIVWKHRRDGDRDIYFLANQTDKPAKTKVLFRVSGRQPELWDPVTGQRRPLPQFTTSADGRTEIELEFAPSGSCFVVFGRSAQAGEPKAKKNFPKFEPVLELTGAWDVQFDPQWFYPDNGTGGKVRFEKLEDWTKRPEEAIKYYSGVATYRKSFDYTPSQDQARPLFLDFGKVNDLARVRLNGQELGIVWTEPYRLAVGSALKAGSNTLEVEIATPWFNRLQGDDKLDESQRRTNLKEIAGIIDIRQPLVPSGLLGPVTIRQAE